MTMSPVRSRTTPAGAFAETNLQELIEKAGVKKIVLVGYMAHICVSTTAREAHQRGCEVLIVEDAIGDRNIPGASGEEVTKVSFSADVVERALIECLDGPA